MNRPQQQDPTWRTSSYSNGTNGECVEVAVTASRVRVRDSKFRAGGSLEMTPAGWRAFLDTAAEPETA